MANRVANTREVLIGPTSCLAASLAEFELLMSFAGLVCLTKNSCQHQHLSSRSRVHHYTLSDGLTSDAKTLLADVVPTAVAVGHRVFHKIVKIWR